MLPGSGEEGSGANHGPGGQRGGINFYTMAKFPPMPLKIHATQRSSKINKCDLVAVRFLAMRLGTFATALASASSNC